MIGAEVGKLHGGFCQPRLLPSSKAYHTVGIDKDAAALADCSNGHRKQVEGSNIATGRFPHVARLPWALAFIFNIISVLYVD